MPTARSWLVDVRKIALLACITGVAGIVPSVWTNAQSMRAIGLSRPEMRWLIYLGMIVAVVFTAILPAFMYALYLNEATLRIPKHAGVIALLAAAAIVLQTAWHLPATIRYLGPWRGASVLDSPVPWTAAHLIPLINLLANVILILLLAALFRGSMTESSESILISQFLRISTKIAVIAWGIWVSFELLRLFATPFMYFHLRDLILQRGIQPPGLGMMIGLALEDLVSQASIFAAPYVVYKSMSFRLDKLVWWNEGRDFTTECYRNLLWGCCVCGRYQRRAGGAN